MQASIAEPSALMRQRAQPLSHGAVAAAARLVAHARPIGPDHPAPLRSLSNDAAHRRNLGLLRPPLAHPNTARRCATASRFAAGVTIFLSADPSGPHCPTSHPQAAAPAARSRLPAPASASFSTPIICSSVNRDRFIVRPFLRSDSNRCWRKIRGSAPSVMARGRSTLHLLSEFCDFIDYKKPFVPPRAALIPTLFRLDASKCPAPIYQQ